MAMFTVGLIVSAFKNWNVPGSNDPEVGAG